MQKTVLITGASSGIGKETAYEFARKGYHLVLVARRMENLQEIKQDILKKFQLTVSIFSIDLSKPESANLLYDLTTKAELSIDILINNAGFGIAGGFADSNIVEIENLIILNILTLTKLTRLYLADMQHQNAGHIINISSTSAFQAIPGFSTYAASKAYVLHFSEAIAVELAKTNIKVTAICPGATESEFAKKAKMSKLKMFNNIPTSETLAQFIYKAMTKNEVVAIQGLKNKLLAFSVRITPRSLITRIAGKFIER